MEKFTDKEALDYHSQGKPGKIEIIASKPMAKQKIHQKFMTTQAKVIL